MYPCQDECVRVRSNFLGVAGLQFEHVRTDWQEASRDYARQAAASLFLTPTRGFAAPLLTGVLLAHRIQAE